MRRRRLLLGAGTIGLTRAAAAAAWPGGTASPTAAAPLVLELFTSQGCSSCPPADALLGVLARQPGVIALAWHVDYWDGLGWHDPFASRFATDRQRAYAARLDAEVYTPALVVGGRRIVVGSDRGAVAAAMAQAGDTARPVTLRREAAGLVAETGPLPTPLTALLVGYDPMRSTAIGAGENGGRRLSEYRIVRSVAPLGPWQGAVGPLALPALPAGQGAVLLLQDAALKIRAAADLPPAEATG
jgi:hypothetical protein